MCPLARRILFLYIFLLVLQVFFFFFNDNSPFFFPPQPSLAPEPSFNDLSIYEYLANTFLSFLQLLEWDKIGAH